MLLNDDDIDANKNEGGDNKEEETANNTTKRHEQSSTGVKQRDEEDYQRLKKKFKILRQVGQVINVLSCLIGVHQSFGKLGTILIES